MTATGERSVNLTGPIQVTLFLPFLHPFSSDGSGADLFDRSSAWRHWFCRIAPEHLGKVFDYSYFFTPEVRRLLFPELHGWEGREDQAPYYDADCTVRALRSAFRTTQSTTDFVESATRLTWVLPRPWLRSKLRLQVDDVDTHFTIDWVDSLLLPQHAGILIVKLTTSGQMTSAQAATFMRLIKKRAFRRRLTVPLPRFELLNGTTTDWQAILQDLLGELQTADPKWGGSMIAETFGTNFRYIALTATPVGRTARTPFESSAEEVAFAVATGHGGSSQVESYSSIAMVEYRRNGMLNTWENWRVIAYDGCISIAMLTGAADLDARMQTFTEISEWAFAPLQALLIAQQIRLYQLTARVQQTPNDMHEAAAHLNATEREFVKFRRVLWHEQITHAPIGGRLHRLLHQDMRLSIMSAFLKEELAIVKSRVDAESEEARTRAAERTSSLVGFLTVVGVPLSLYIAFAQPLLNGWISSRIGQSPATAMIVLCGLSAILVALYTVVGLVNRRRGPKAEKRELAGRTNAPRRAGEDDSGRL